MTNCIHPFTQVQNKLSAADVRHSAGELSFPTSVIEYLQGLIGQPYGGFPEPFRSQVLKNLPCTDGRPGEDMEPFDFEATKAKLVAKYGDRTTDR